MTRRTRKQMRNEAIAAEISRRENALEVPVNKQVYVLNQHFSDEGGPRELRTTGYGLDPDTFNAADWRQRLQNAPHGWTPVEVVPDDRARTPASATIGDFSKISGLYLFSQRAADALEHLLMPCGVFLPVRCTYGHYVGFRLDATLDAIDTEKTRASWDGSREDRKARASSIYRYAFHNERLGPFPIFRVPQHFNCLVLHEFMAIVRSKRFTGFRFRRVWPSVAAFGQWC